MVSLYNTNVLVVPSNEINQQSVINVAFSYRYNCLINECSFSNPYKKSLKPLYKHFHEEHSNVIDDIK